MEKNKKFLQRFDEQIIERMMARSGVLEGYKQDINDIYIYKMIESYFSEDEKKEILGDYYNKLDNARRYVDACREAQIYLEGEQNGYNKKDCKNEKFKLFVAHCMKINKYVHDFKYILNKLMAETSMDNYTISTKAEIDAMNANPHLELDSQDKARKREMEKEEKEEAEMED